MDSLPLKTVFGFTRQEWFYAYLFDQTDEEALASVNRLFAMHTEHGSDGFVFAHHDLLRLAYVNEECRAKVLTLIGAGGARRLGNESFFSAPQLKRGPLGGHVRSWRLNASSRPARG